MALPPVTIDRAAQYAEMDARRLIVEGQVDAVLASAAARATANLTAAFADANLPAATLASEQARLATMQADADARVVSIRAAAAVRRAAMRAR